MNVRIPRAWETLPDSQKDAIVEFSRKQGEEQMEKIHSLIIKLACIALNDGLGIGEKRLNVFIKAYRKILKEHEVYMKDEVNDEVVDRKIRDIFKEGFKLENENISNG